MKTIMRIRNLSFLLMLFAVASCSNNQQRPTGGATPLKVLKVKPDSVTLYQEYPTTLQGIQTVEIRPRIAGYIERMMVDEGDFVHTGQVLFKLNAQDLSAQVRSAEAQVKVAKAAVETAKINVDKTEPLVKKNIVSEFQLQTAKAALASAEAQLAQAKANLANLTANLDYSIIKSPTDGTIGTFPYRVGSLVSSSSSQPLTTISNTSSIYAYFSTSEQNYLSLTEGLKGKTTQEKLAQLPPVQLIMANGHLYNVPGHITTASGIVDQETGSINMRATFPNPEGLLKSGGSGNVRLPQHYDSVLLIPQSDTYEIQGQHYVFIVDANNQVHSQGISVISGNLKDSYVVTKGLKAGDVIAAEGVATLKEGMTIQPKTAQEASQK